MKIRVNFAIIFHCFIWLILLSTLSFAQSFARYNPATRNLEFRISSTTKEKIKKVMLFDSSTGKTTLIDVNRITAVSLGGLKVTLDIAESLGNLAIDPATLTIIVQPKPEEDKKTVVALQVFQIGSQGSTELENKEPEGRDDANIYLSGEAIVERKEKPQFSLDIKLEKETAIKDIPLRLAFFTEIKASNDDGATDKSNGGIKFIGTANRFRYEGSAELETDYKFRVTNFITSQELRYLLPTWRFPRTETPNAILFPRLFIGAELGANLKSPVQRDERGIARVKAGALLTLKIFDPFGKSSFLDLGIRKLVWENKFEQRWFLTKEQAYDTQDDELILRDFGRKPRGHFLSSLHFMFNDFFGPTLKYEWGQLPPLYKKVDHRLTFGLAFALTRKPV